MFIMDLGALFGSRVRAEVLEVLASTPRPLSAYRVARAAGAQPIQVLSILKSLEPHLVQHAPNGWVLTSEPLRRFLRDEISRREADRRAEKDELLVHLGLKPRLGHGPG